MYQVFIMNMRTNYVMNKLNNIMNLSHRIQLFTLILYVLKKVLTLLYVKFAKNLIMNNSCHYAIIALEVNTRFVLVLKIFQTIIFIVVHANMQYLRIFLIINMLTQVKISHCCGIYKASFNVCISNYLNQRLSFIIYVVK